VAGVISLRGVMLKYLALLCVILILSGCECDQICEENKKATDVLDHYKTDTEVLDYLNLYSGEAPSAAKYSVFVIWGAENKNKFLSIMNHPKVNQRNMDFVVYQISDMGLSDLYCKIYASGTKTENDLAIRKRLLGCEFGL
jgi:hypothetical protein